MTHIKSELPRFFSSSQYTHPVSSDSLSSLSSSLPIWYNRKWNPRLHPSPKKVHDARNCYRLFSPRTQSLSCSKSIPTSITRNVSLCSTKQYHNQFPNDLEPSCCLSLSSFKQSCNLSPNSIVQSRKQSLSPITQSRNQSPNPMQSRNQSPNPMHSRNQSPNRMRSRNQSPNPMQSRNQSPNPMQSCNQTPSPNKQSLCDYIDLNTQSPDFVTCVAPISHIPKQRRCTPKNDVRPYSSKHNPKLCTQLSSTATGDSVEPQSIKPYFGIWEAPYPPVQRFNIRQLSSPRERRKPRPSSSPVPGLSQLHQSSSRSWTTIYIHNTHSLRPTSQKSGRKTSMANSQLYRKFEAEIKKPSQTLVTIPRPSRNRDISARKTPWMLSKRRSQLRCLELNLSPERLFSARPSENVCLSRGNSPDRRERSLSPNLPSCTTAYLRRIPSSTHSAGVRTPNPKGDNLRKLSPSISHCSSPYISSSRTSSTSVLVMKLITDKMDMFLSLQKHFKKFVGNILFYFCYAYYALGSFIYC